MALRGAGEGEGREKMLKAIMLRRGCDRDEAVVILRRAADRLGGYSHAEAVRRNPLPGEARTDG